MTDKLICPICEEELIPYNGDDKILQCVTPWCELCGLSGLKYMWEKLMSWKVWSGKCDVLQKKLDKAMGFLTKHKKYCGDVNAAGVWISRELINDALKEIEDIKE